MKTTRGLGVSPGVAIGPAFVYDPSIHITQRKIPASKIEAEIKRLEAALAAASRQVGLVHERIEKKLGPQTAGIFSFQLFVLEDPDFREQTHALIRERQYNAESAVHRFLRDTIRKLTAREATMSERANDFADLEGRIVQLLQGRRTGDLNNCPAGSIVLGPDLTPSQTVTLDKRRVAGFVTEAGGHTSHTAILARNLGIPAVVGAGRLLSKVSDGDRVVVDGSEGVVVLRPDRKTVSKYQDRRTQLRSFEKRLVSEFKDMPAETRDGCKVDLLGNIEFPDEIESALSFGAAGIGLYRTEFLFLQGPRLPDEETQLAAYQKAIDALDGRPLVIRTMDLGADKDFSLTQRSRGSDKPAAEFNPFLGCRSIRLSLREPETFKVQLRAILRAAVSGDVRIMFPMISSLAELQGAKACLQEARAELAEEGVPHQPVLPLGIMIEVPSAVMIADILAREVDFFSIGTNDLIQYTLAVDRVNEAVADLYQPTHPAILRMLRRLIEVGTETGIRVAMCGEMSGNVSLIVLLAGLGLREFSVSPASIPEIKKVLRSITLKDARQVARRALSQVDGAVTEEYLMEFTRRLVPEMFGEFEGAAVSGGRSS